MSGNALARQDVAAPLSHRESEDAPLHPPPPPTVPLPEMWAVKMVLHFCLSRASRNTNKYYLTRSWLSSSLSHSPLLFDLSRSHIHPSLSLSLSLLPTGVPLQSPISPSPSLSLPRRSRNLSFFLDLSHPQSPSTLSTFIVLKSTFKLSQSE